MGKPKNEGGPDRVAPIQTADDAEQSSASVPPIVDSINQFAPAAIHPVVCFSCGTEAGAAAVTVSDQAAGVVVFGLCAACRSQANDGRLRRHLGRALAALAGGAQ